MSRLLFLARFGLALGARKYDVAAQLCERFLRGSRGRDDEHLVRRFAARAYEQLSAWDKALEHSQVVLKVDPDDFEMLRVAAESLMKIHRFYGAAHYARRMFEVNLAQSRSHDLEALFSSWLANNRDKVNGLTGRRTICGGLRIETIQPLTPRSLSYAIGPEGSTTTPELSTIARHSGARRFDDRRHILRNALGILIGIAIVTILVAYGGVGTNLLIAVHRNQVPHESIILYTILVWYFLGVTLLLLMAGVLTVAELKGWKNKESKNACLPNIVFVIYAGDYSSYGVLWGRWYQGSGSKESVR